jgi:hypothetical protein
LPGALSAEALIIGSRQYPPRMMLALVISDRAGNLEQRLRQEIE